MELKIVKEVIELFICVELTIKIIVVINDYVQFIF